MVPLRVELSRLFFCLRNVICDFNGRLSIQCYNSIFAICASFYHFNDGNNFAGLLNFANHLFFCSFYENKFMYNRNPPHTRSLDLYWKDKFIILEMDIFFCFDLFPPKVERYPQAVNSRFFCLENCDILYCFVTCSHPRF